MQTHIGVEPERCERTAVRSQLARSVLTVALLCVPAGADAQPVSVPHTFTNGTTADADEVNENFEALIAEIEDLRARVTDLEAQLTNACGGTTTLANAPGDPCGACGLDQYECSGTEATVCDGNTTANVCGGCAALANPPGAPCGACGDGTYVCSGTENTFCSGGTPPPCP